MCGPAGRLTCATIPYKVPEQGHVSVGLSPHPPGLSVFLLGFRAGLGMNSQSPLHWSTVLTPTPGLTFPYPEHPQPGLRHGGDSGCEIHMLPLCLGPLSAAPL